MPSLIEDFDYIARRASEIRAARYQELGVSPPATSEQPPHDDERTAPAPQSGGGFQYAPGYEHLAAQSAPIDDWGCCLPG